MKPKVCLVSVTPDAEKTIGYIARVSNPANQNNPKVAGLLKYCIQHGHWSVFEQATMTLQIETTRGLAVSNPEAPFVLLPRVFPNAMQTPLHWVTSHCLNCVVKTQRTDRIVSMTWILLWFRSLRSSCKIISSMVWNCTSRCLKQAWQRSVLVLYSPRRRNKTLHDRKS